FTNNGSLQLFFVGTGSAFSKINFQTNVLVIKGSDHLLIDCGALCPLAFTTYNSSVALVKNILVTHSHADHIGGLEEMALLGRYVTKQRPKMIISDYYKKILWNESLKGGCAYGEYADTGYMTFDDYFEQVAPTQIGKTPRPLYEVNVGSINVKMFRTKHIPDSAGDWKKSFYSLGTLIDERILYTCDTRFDKDLLDWICSKYNIEYIFHDCQFFPGGVHASYDDLKTLPKDMKSKMFLCHYADTYKKVNPKKDGFLGFAERAVYYDFGKK
ncbi:MAG: MBL fold metallo-hydrolase, partial [Treponema sp.]|nr:MBL fold metallo-hydrolase [Treponema sp.]